MPPIPEVPSIGAAGVIRAGDIVRRDWGPDAICPRILCGEEAARFDAAPHTAQYWLTPNA